MKALKIAGIVIAVLLVIVVALPFLIDVNLFRPQIETGLSSSLGRQVNVGNLKLAILGGTVAADDLSIADDPAFSKQPFVRAKALNIGVELMPLIFSKQLHVTDLTLDQPQVSLVRAADGKWNFSSLGAASHSSAPAASEKSPAPAVQATKPASAPEESSTANLSVSKLSVKDGSVSMEDLASHAKPKVYQKVNVTVENFSFTSPFPFILTADLPAGGTIKLDGKAGAINSTDASLTPVSAKVDVKHLDLANAGIADPSSGIAGIADFDGTVASDGRQARTSGTITVNKLKLSPKGSPAGRAVQVKYTTDYELQKMAGQLTQCDVAMGKALAHLTGTYKTEPAATVLDLKLNADSMPVDDLEAMLPALGVILPSGSSLQGGTLSTDLTIVGPVDKLVITGPVRLVNTKLAHFDLGSKMAAISALSGAKTGSDTTIQNLSANARVAPEGISTQNVNLTIPSLGEVTGNGTISPQNALDYKMSAKLSGGVAGGLTQLAGLGSKGAGTIPFFIQGTTSDPKFVPDVKGMLSNQLGGFGGKGQQSPANILNGLGGLLGGKKK